MHSYIESLNYLQQLWNTAALPPAGLGMAIQRRKRMDGHQWYGLCRIAGTDLYLFANGNYYRASAAMVQSAAEHAQGLNDLLIKRRGMHPSYRLPR